jgi:NADPH2:quinone reductase
MKAVGLTKYLAISDPESLVDLERAVPEPSGRDLLVKVEAVSVNPVDTKIRMSKSDVEEQPRILGWDAAGIVEAIRRLAIGA